MSLAYRSLKTILARRSKISVIWCLIPSDIVRSGTNSVQIVVQCLVGIVIKIIMNNTADPLTEICIFQMHSPPWIVIFWVNCIVIIQTTDTINRLKKKTHLSWILFVKEFVIYPISNAQPVERFLNRRVMKWELCFIKNSWRQYKEIIGWGAGLEIIERQGFNNKWGPTVQHRELCPFSWDRTWWGWNEKKNVMYVWLGHFAVQQKLEQLRFKIIIIEKKTVAKMNEEKWTVMRDRKSRMTILLPVPVARRMSSRRFLVPGLNHWVVSSAIFAETRWKESWEGIGKKCQADR